LSRQQPRLDSCCIVRGPLHPRHKRLRCLMASIIAQILRRPSAPIAINYFPGKALISCAGALPTASIFARSFAPTMLKKPRFKNSEEHRERRLSKITQTSCSNPSRHNEEPIATLVARFICMLPVPRPPIPDKQILIDEIVACRPSNRIRRLAHQERPPAGGRTTDLGNRRRW
jgi:hypothetical protein